jgi:hypothetical protein
MLGQPAGMPITAQDGPRIALPVGTQDAAASSASPTADREPGRRRRTPGHPTANRLRPAEPCYRYLLDGPERWCRPDKSNSQRSPDYDHACRWLSESLRGPVRGLLLARQRIPQERLGLRVLRGNPELLVQWL